MFGVTKWVGFSIATVSLICTILTLLVIWKMKKWNGYLMLISMMTTYQLLYDINYILGVCPGYEVCMVWHFLDILGGLGNAYTSNIISFTVIYVVYRVRSFDIFGNFPYIFFITGLIPLVFAICDVNELKNQVDDDIPFEYCTLSHSALAKTTSEFYYWTRLGSILFNFVAFGYISFKIKKIGSAVNHGGSQDTQDSGFSSEQQMSAVGSLVSRLKYYPLAQAICRAGSAWNEWTRGAASPVSSMVAAITAPLSGTCYFIIFMMMQPTARITLWRMLGLETTKSTLHRNTSDPSLTPPSPSQQQEQLSQIFRPTSVDYYDESDLDDMINRVNIDRAISLHNLPWMTTTNPAAAGSTTSPLADPDYLRDSEDNPIHA